MKSFQLTAAAAALFTLQSASAVTIWADDFSDGSRASAPNPYDYAGGAAGNDYSFTPASGHTLSTSSGYLAGSDPGANQTLINIFANQYSQTSFSAGTRITVTFDFRVTSMTGTGASVPRVSIMSGSAVNGSEVLTVGFSSASFTGQPAGSLGFYYGTGASNAPTAGSGIGINTTGFSFGTYDSATAGNNDTNDDWYRISLSMTQGSSAVTGLITLLDGSGNATSSTAGFSPSLGSALNWTGGVADGVKISTGATGAALFDMDNINIDATTVPEPGSLLLAGLSALPLLRRRRA